MEDNVVSKEFILNDDEKDKKQKRPTNAPKQKISFKEKTCEIIAYNKKDKTLDIRFDGFGIRMKNVDKFDGKEISVKYKGEIGKANFICRL